MNLFTVFVTDNVASSSSSISSDADATLENETNDGGSSRLPRLLERLAT